MLDRAKRATVLVFTAASKSTRADEKLGSGSGYFINRTGLLITNNHVVDPMHLKSDREKQEFHYRTGRLNWRVVSDAGTTREAAWDAAVVYQNEKADQAVLQAYDERGGKLNTPSHLMLLPASLLRERMQVWAFGFPGGDTRRGSQEKNPEVSITVGHVLDLPRTPAGRIRMIYTDVIARPGNSGGPMIQEDGLLVGTVTLMDKPADRADTGGANYSALVPAALTAEMLRGAFQLGKIPAGSDLMPFIDLLSGRDGRVNLPEYERLDGVDVLFFEDGDRVYGRLLSEVIEWKSNIGRFQIPPRAIAYLLNTRGVSHLILEGGNYLSAEQPLDSFRFEPQGGKAGETLTAGIAAVGLRLPPEPLDAPIGDLLVLDSDICHLVLANVTGKMTLRGKTGSVEVALPDVQGLERQTHQTYVVSFRDGRRVTGEFLEGSYQAVIAASGVPVEFHLPGLSTARVQTIEQRPGRVEGLGLADALRDADRNLRRIAQSLDDGRLQQARDLLDHLIEPAEFRRLPRVDKDQVRLLNAVCLLREGQWDDAATAFRQSLTADDETIVACALAHNEVLKRFPDRRFDGEPLSNRVVFVQAGMTLADELLRAIRDFLKDADRYEGRSRGEYLKTLAAIVKHEEAMTVAGVYAGEEADDELIRLWNFATRICSAEVRRLEAAMQEERSDRASPAGGRFGAPGARSTHLVVQRRIDELRQDRDATIETWKEFHRKLWSYGFRIEDPDIQKQRTDDVPGGAP